MWTCPPSGLRTSHCRRPPKARPKSAPGWPPPAPSSGTASRAYRPPRRAGVPAAEAGGRTVRCNADADGALLEEIAAPEADGRVLLTEAAERMRLSARGYHRVLRVARTLADLDGSGIVRRLHVAEALSYRRVVPGRQAALMAG